MFLHSCHCDGVKFIIYILEGKNRGLPDFGFRLSLMTKYALSGKSSAPADVATTKADDVERADAVGSFCYSCNPKKADGNPPEHGARVGADGCRPTDQRTKSQVG